MKVVYVDVKNLKSSEYNPRKWQSKAIESLKKSIEKFGIVDPIIVNSAKNRKNVVIGGHFRLKVAKDLGIKKVPVVYLNIPDIEKEKELNLRLNRNLGEWDWEMLKNWNELDLIDIGFLGEELNQIFGKKSVEIKANKKESIEKMELQFNEKYDYIVLLFKNRMDWLNALQKFDIKQVNYSLVKKAKIGLGRVIDGKKALQKI